MIEISSDQNIEIEQHFKITAGPGAGKTYWRINHVRNVLRQSVRLARTAKIGCITFTNTGVDKIRERLGGFAGRVKVATIHSFLYNNIVKPYAFLLKDGNNGHLINLRFLDGHDEHIPSSYMVFRWKKQTNQLYLSDDHKIYKCLVGLDWKFNEHGELTLLPRKTWRLNVGGRYHIRKDSLIEYKKLFWNIGRIHHEDVLYFAYRLITEHPEVLNFVRAKFPYIFIDEFQDTHPIQTTIIKNIAEENTIVGVIGDPTQSIYKFQGAERQDFIQFTLPDINEYYIGGNRRSTIEIINLLNKIRGDDIQQCCVRKDQGTRVKLLLGDKFEAVRRARGEVGELVILSRNNEIVGQIRNLNNNIVSDLWGYSRVLDSNYQRQDLIYNTLHAVELVRFGNHQEARREVIKLFRTYEDGAAIPNSKRREYSITLIQMIIEQYHDYLEKKIICYINNVHDFIKNSFGVKIGAKVSSGKYKEFIDQYTCKEFVQGLRLKDDTNPIRAIHKAKGTQFDSVLVVLENEEELKYINEPDTEAEEDSSRIYYVALSRARNNLYITLPELEAEKRRLTETFDIDIISL